MGYPTGLLIDASKGTPTDNNIRANTLQVQNTVIAGCNVPVDYAANATATGWNRDSAVNWFSNPASSNSILATNDEVKLTAPYNYANPDFTPQAGSPLLTGASFTNPKLSGSFFTPVTFKGAVGASGDDADWWKGWSKVGLNL
jgi:hypothetical protein